MELKREQSNLLKSEMGGIIYNNEKQAEEKNKRLRRL